MMKAVAGGLHFETINRPLGAESNGKPSISVGPGSLWHRGKGRHLCTLIVDRTMLLQRRSSDGGVLDSDVI